MMILFCHLKHTTAHLLSLAILCSIAVAAMFFIGSYVPDYWYFTAILATIMILSVKVATIFVQGPEMKKLSMRMTSLESRSESSLQLMLVLVICFKTGKFTWSSANSLLSSVLMIGKSGAESHLTFGRENLLEQTGPGWRGLFKKLKLLTTYSPVFIATAAFRLTALAVVFTENFFWFYTMMLLSVVPPTMLFLLTKICALKDLSVMDLWISEMGEISTISLWGGRGREGSKKLQLFMQVYLLLLHSSFMVMVLLDIRLPNMSFSGRVRYQLQPLPATAERVRIGAIVSLSTGWLSGVVLTPPSI